MMQSQFLLCAVPAELWNAQASLTEPLSILQALIQDALGIERRLPKNVNLENERSRYTLCCNQIEGIASQFITPFKTGDEFKEVLKIKRFPIFTIDEVYMHFLVQVMALEAEQETAAKIRLGASFFPPDEVVQHSKEFEQLAQKLGWHEKRAVKNRRNFFQWAGVTGCGVIEIQNPMVTTAQLEPIPDVMAVVPSERATWIAPSDIADEVISESRRVKMAQQLRSQIERALHTQETVNFSNQPHDITTEVLNDFVYTSEDVKPKDIRVVYADGSKGETFPIHCLPKFSDEKLYRLKSLPPLRIALISMRHLELDRDIDMAWFRNREASQSRTLSEADRFCYEYSMKQFTDLAALSHQSGGVHLHLYHTGFEPAVIAFYRAFLHTLRHRQNDFPGILIVPHYYRGDNPYEHGRPWL